MSIIDIVIILLFIPFVFNGIKNGFLVQAASLFALFAGVWLASRFSLVLSGWASPVLKISPQALAIVFFVVIMVASILLFALVGKALKAVVKLALLSWLDRSLGAALAVVKGIIVSGLLIILFSFLNTKFGWVPEETLNSSFLYNPLKELAYTVFPYIKELIA